MANKSKLSKICDYLELLAEDLELNTDFGSIALDAEDPLNDDWKSRGHQGSYHMNCTPVVLNFPGSSDWAYFIALPADVTDVPEDLDEYPVFIAEFDALEISFCARNFREFVASLFAQCSKLEAPQGLDHFSACAKPQMPLCLLWFEESDDLCCVKPAKIL